VCPPHCDSATQSGVEAMRVGTWALGGPLDMVRKALIKGGAGF